MNNSDGLFDMLFRMVLKNTFNPNKSNPKDDRADNELMLAALGLLAFVGADAMKVVFRENFGNRGLNLFRVILSFIAFMIIACIGYHFSNPEVEINPQFGTHKTFLIASFFYAFLGFYVLIKGIRHKKASGGLNLHPEYKGDSRLLASLITSGGWSQQNVQSWAEPLLTLAFGGFLAAFNLLWGLPIVFCALSIWGYQIMEYLFGHNPVNEKVQQHGYQNQNDDFTQTHY